MTAADISRVRISGFRSIADADISLDRINLLIGSNVSGKSNILGIFELSMQSHPGNSRPTLPTAVALRYCSATEQNKRTKSHFGPPRLGKVSMKRFYGRTIEVDA